MKTQENTNKLCEFISSIVYNIKKKLFKNSLSIDLEPDDKVFLTDSARKLTGLPKGSEFKVKEVMSKRVAEYNVVLISEDVGIDWVGFFSEAEVIPCNNKKL